MMLQHLSAVFAIRVGHTSRSSTAPAGDHPLESTCQSGGNNIPFSALPPFETLAKQRGRWQDDTALRGET